MFMGLMQRCLLRTPIVPSAAAWTPASLGSSLFGWWTADDTSTVDTSSSNVWTPKAGSAGALTQATASSRGTYTSGVKLSFDTDDGLNMTSAPSVYDAVAVITSNSSNSGWRTLFWATGSHHPVLIEQLSSRLGAFNGAFADSGFTIATSTQAIVHVRMDASGNVSMSLNGGTITGTITTFTTSSDRPIAFVGNSDNAGIGDIQPVGDIHAIVVANSLLSTTSGAELDKVIGSLAWEWGLQSLLPVGHAYKSARP